MRTEPLTAWDFLEHPEDRLGEFFRMRLRYGPKDLLQAQGQIPCGFLDASVHVWSLRSMC